MNILYICPRFPFPPQQGDKVAIANQLQYLARTNTITLLTMTEGKEGAAGAAALSRYCARVEVFKRRPNYSLANFFIALYRADPFTAIRYWSPQMHARSKQLIESGAFDIVHAAFYYMGQYVVHKEIRVPRRTATVLDAHNVEYRLYRRYVSLVRNPLVKLAALAECLRIKNYEPSLYRRFDVTIAPSESDRRFMADLSGAPNIVVNPFAMAVSPDRAPDTSREEEDTIAYVGHLRYIANDDAVRFFYTEIFPLVKKQAPGVRFIIAGREPSAYARSLSRDPAVKVTGAVSDMRDVLSRVAVVIVPLRLGGGVRMKILEAWSAAKAVVSTTVGAEGIDYADRKDIYIADTPKDFSDAVIALLRHKDVREGLGRAGYRKVCEQYSPERLGENLEVIYARARSEKGARRPDG